MHKLAGEAYRKTRLCVDSYNHGVLKGRYYNPGIKGGGREFESLAQFLTDVEAMFDSVNFPQSFTVKRSFAAISDSAPGESSGLEPQAGKMGNFVIRILFRQHTSWQGSITWIEENSEQTFRSVLELILLIDSALGGCRERPDPGWQETPADVGV